MLVMAKGGVVKEYKQYNINNDVTMMSLDTACI